MPDISTIASGGPFPPGNAQSVYSTSSLSKPSASRFRLADPELTSASRAPQADSVELSGHARFIDQLRSMPEIRTDRVAQVKAAIARGDYDSPDKLDHILSALLDDLQ